MGTNGLMRHWSFLFSSCKDDSGLNTIQRLNHILINIDQVMEGEFGTNSDGMGIAQEDGDKVRLDDGKDMRDIEL